MDAIGDPSIREIWVMKSAQVGWTEILGNAVGFYIEQDPSPMLMVQPTLDMGEAWSKDRFAPMLRDTPVLHGLVRDARARDSGNTLLHKQFPGGHITVAGANSPASLAMRPIRVVLCDDIDRFPSSVGTEGDPIRLARKRANNFWNRRFLAGSTPTVKGASKIEIGFDSSDKRRYFVPCPHCDEFQVLTWSRVKWPEGEPEKAYYVCENDCVIEDAERSAMVRKGEWRATAPFKGVAGFHIWEAYSPWRSLGEIATDFLAAKDHPELLKVWVNTSLGEPWEDRQGETLDENSLRARRGTWTAEEIPADVLCCTVGCDVQDDRLEPTVIGWGTGQRAFVIAHHRLYGSPGQDAVWQAFDRLLLEKYKTADGRTVRVLGACIDSGGHHTQRAYSFCSAREGRNVYAIKGDDGPKPTWPRTVTKSKTHAGGRVWIIGVDTIKDWLRGAFAVRDETLPHHVSFAADFPDEFIAQYLIEKRVTRYDLSGRPVRKWMKPPAARVDAWAALQYGYAALEALRVQRRLTLTAPKRVEPPPEEPELSEMPNVPRGTRRRTRFASSW